MKRIGILMLVFFTCFALAAWPQAQQPATKPPAGRLSHLRHRMVNRMPMARGATVSESFNAHANQGDKTRIWELGTYDGGTWAALNVVNDFGVAVGVGDVPPLGPDGVGYTHTLAVSLFGPNAGEWIDLGTLGGEQPRGWEEPYSNEISDTGLIVTHSTTPSGQVHGVVWNEMSGMVDLGTLADTGNPRFRNHNSSYAAATNRLGTLIVGWSGVDGSADAPVVWTPSLTWKNGKLVTKWTIHKLNVSRFPDLTGWQAWEVNDFGQIDGIAFNDEQTIFVGMLWNPRAEGRGWKLTSLPPDPDYPLTLAFHLNDNGQIVGAVLSTDQNTWLPRLWKPLDAKRRRYSQPIELALPGGFMSCESTGINELGDIVGDCWNDTEDLAVRWNTKHPTFYEVLPFPGTTSFSWGVNNNRIAVVTYGGDEKCPADTYGSCGGAIQLH